MGDITDIVVEGLQYPLSDLKKYLSFGVVNVVMMILSLGGFVASSYYAYLFVKINEEGIRNSFIAPSSSSIVLAAVLFILAFIVALFILGYQFKILKYSIAKNSEVPDFSDYVQIFKDGLKVFAVQIAYCILPGILFLLGFMLAVNTNVSGAVNAIGALILAVDIIFAVIVFFVEIMAIAYMADKGALSSAFEFKNICNLISDMGIGQYVGIILFLIIVLAIISIAASVILEIIGFVVALIIPVILVAPFLIIILNALLVNSFMGMVTYRVYGSIYNIAAGMDVENSESVLESAESLGPVNDDVGSDTLESEVDVDSESASGDVVFEDSESESEN